MDEDVVLTQVSLDELIVMIIEYMETNGMLKELLEKYSDEE